LEVILECYHKNNNNEFLGKNYKLAIMSPTVNPNKSRWILLFIILILLFLPYFSLICFFSRIVEIEKFKNHAKNRPGLYIKLWRFQPHSLIFFIVGCMKNCVNEEKCDSIWDLSMNAPIFNNFFLFIVIKTNRNIHHVHQSYGLGLRNGERNPLRIYSLNGFNSYDNHENIFIMWETNSPQFIYLLLLFMNHGESNAISYYIFVLEKRETIDSSFFSSFHY